MAEQRYNLDRNAESALDDAYAEMTARMERLINASLCANCKHLSDCTFLLRASAPIIECELHECGNSSRPRLTVVKPHNRKESRPSVGEPPLGLCGNCDHLAECRLPKAPSGVWHCEEYS